MSESSHSAAEVEPQKVVSQTQQEEASTGEALPHDQVDAVWVKLFCSKDNEKGQEYYFTNMVNNEPTWEEPEQGFYLWDYMTGTYHVCGLQEPTSKETLEREKAAREAESELPEEKKDRKNGYQGYLPAVHGNYDSKAPYAAYHSWLEYKEALEKNPQVAAPTPQAATYQTYDSTAQFNAHTGHAQTGEQSAERHSAANKAGRQMNAYFDVDSAANSHDGRSLKEERRHQHLSKKQVQEYNKARREKKHKKRMAFLTS